VNLVVLTNQEGSGRKEPDMFIKELIITPGVANHPALRHYSGEASK
jgi:hypothetical protein